MQDLNLISQFTYVPFSELEKEREQLSRLYTFIRRYVQKTISLSENVNYAMALFSNDGVLLDLFSKEEYLLQYFAEDNIRAGSDWTSVGYNAISEGLRTKTSMATIGTENESIALHNYAVYFAPINMLSPYEPYEPMEQCGVAIICPLQFAWTEYLTMTRGIAHDMMITLQFNNIATMYYERSGRGILSIDTMMSTKNNRLATYYNPLLFEILETEPIEMYYKPVEVLIDPLPANKELWDIVYNHRTIQNYPMTITVHGKDVEVVASTDAFNQPSINAHGVTFFLTTQARITAKLSKKVANGAVKTFDNIIGEAPALLHSVRRAKQMAMTDSNIMIMGESGTGKDVFAQAIHNAGNRRNGPFIALNCGAMPRDLIESELFGYENGAFTGARKGGNIGKFELASGGTIFLDEIGEMPLDLQAKLLRVVEAKQLMRLGGTKTITVDIRIIAATNANLEEMIEKKQFRADLYYRLSTMKLQLPPLRERKDDIIPLANHFIRSISARIEKENVMRFTPAAEKLMKQLDWPGNVRELQNLVECIVQLCPGDVILPEYILDNVSYYHRSKLINEFVTAESVASAHPDVYADAASVKEETPDKPDTQIPPVSVPVSAPAPTAPAAPTPPEAAPITRKKRQKFTRERLLEALEATGNNRSESAVYLGISRRTLYRKLEEFGIDE